MTEISKSEIDQAELFLVDRMVEIGHPIKITSAMQMAAKAGIRWRAVIAARRRAGIVATRGSGGEWIWTLQPGAAAEKAAA